ncbi:Crp/Fnr family transcriptional regulator [Spongiimicrobium salis]|uniref:Crp/Fnr family transcriptional regulator n=1 Tax=Spongiimicrobium salis TaxID=1667022 RepID=UPI00374DBFD5
MKDFLSKIYKVDDDILSEYLSHWEEVIVPRKTVMTAPGKTQRYLYFVLEGIQKSYYLNDDKQHVILFSYAPSFSGDPGSFVTQTPSKYFLETITKSTFLRISYEKHEQLMEEHRQLETLFRKAIEYLLIGVMERQYELMAFDIETRFKIFVKRSPHLISRIPQKDLASYLRMDSTNFSKLINNVRV